MGLDQGSSGAVWRYSKVSLRAIWRSTKAVFVLALALLLSAIMFMGLIVYLKDSGIANQGGVGEKFMVEWGPRHSSDS